MKFSDLKIKYCISEYFFLINFLIKIIHNYGHGGNGIALSRGTVIDAVDLLLEEIKKCVFRAQNRDKNNCQLVAKLYIR